MEEFLRERYKQELDRLAGFYPDQKSLDVDYASLEGYSPELADDLIANPDIVLKAAQEAVIGIKLVDGKGNDIKPNVRFFNLPTPYLIRNINSTHINKLISIQGAINKITDVRPKIDVGTFECRRCGRVYKMPQPQQLYGKLVSPAACSCERRDFNLNLDESTFTDMQRMTVQEPLEALVGGEQAKNLNIWMEDDLTNKLFAGDKVEVVGILRLAPPKKGSSVYEIYLHAIHIEQKEMEFEQIELTPEEEEEIRQLGKDPEIYNKLIRSVAPTIYGYNEIKEALALQLFGGSKGKTFPDGSRIRPDIHVLLIGDPGTAKSMLLTYIRSIAPKGVFVAGKSSSAAGLTATAEKDEDGGWILKAGALVLASGGIACIDEFDKMGEEDRSSMHEAMEQQRISIAKAGIVTQFKSETAILAAANPKFGRFDPNQYASEQFDIPPTLLSRFDLMFPIRDLLDEETDKKMAKHILGSHQAAGVRMTKAQKVLSEKELEEAEKRITPDLDPKLLRSYIAYARKYINPVLTNEARDKIQDYYLNLRKIGKQQSSVPTTPRQLEGLVRLAEASAKGRLSDRVEIEDADRAVRLFDFVMHEIGVDKETGKYDIDAWALGQPKSRSDRMRTVEGVLKRLEEENDMVTKDMIADEVEKDGIKRGELDKLLGNMQREGYIYSPKHGQYKITGSRN